jgi:TorA maturation chaperone TorD
MSLAPEEQARAEFYTLLARLFYAPPDSALLQSLASASGIEAEDDELARTWKGLREAAADANLEEVRDEYDTVFVGTGKSPVTLYACAYSIRYASEAPLAALRADLARLGLERREGVHEPEDHIATLCDTMRHLIAVQARDLDEQRAFFERWIAPAVGALCAAIEAEPRTAFYRPVARFAKVFFDIERTAFEMH